MDFGFGSKLDIEWKDTAPEIQELQEDITFMIWQIEMFANIITGYILLYSIEISLHPFHQGGTCLTYILHVYNAHSLKCSM